MVSLAILTQSYWRDEAFTVMQSAQPLAQILKLLTWDSSPPLYYFLLHGWMKIFGEGEAATRFLSLIFQLGTTVLSFLILKKLTKHKTLSFMAAVMVLLNPFMLFYAFETRPYALFACLVSAAVWAYLNKRRWFLAVVLALMVLTHNFSLFFIFSLLAGFIWQKQSLKVFLPALAAGLIWLPIFWQQIVHVRSGFWIGPLSPKFFSESLDLFFKGYSGEKIFSLSYPLVLILIGLAIIAKIVRGDRAKLAGILYFGPVLGAALVSALVVPLFIERYLLPVVVMLIIWVATGIDELKSINRYIFSAALGLMGLYLVCLFVGDLQLLKTESKPPIKKAVTEILAKIKPDELIIPESELNFLETKYYVQRLNPNIAVWVHFPKGKENLPYYIGWPFFKDETFVTEIPRDKVVWVIKDNGGYYKNVVD